MIKCPLTYEFFEGEHYSNEGIKSFHPRLRQLQHIPFKTRALRKIFTKENRFRRTAYSNQSSDQRRTLDGQCRSWVLLPHSGATIRP